MPRAQPAIPPIIIHRQFLPALGAFLIQLHLVLLNIRSYHTRQSMLTSDYDHVRQISNIPGLLRRRRWPDCQIAKKTFSPRTRSAQSLRITIPIQNTTRAISQINHLLEKISLYTYCIDIAPSFDILSPYCVHSFPYSVQPLPTFCLHVFICLPGSLLRQRSPPPAANPFAPGSPLSTPPIDKPAAAL